MKTIANLLSRSALVASAGWLIYSLTGSIIVNKGAFWLAGGGATMISFIPAALFIYSLYILEKRNSVYRFYVGLLFWVCVISTVYFFVFVVSKMEHWPYGVAFSYIVFMLVALLQALLFVPMSKKGKKLNLIL